MGEIQWSKLHEATSKENRPTPGYLFNEIVHDVSYADPRRIPDVATYLADCVDGDHAHVKLKALFVIKALAYRIPPFCESMQPRIASVQEAASFSGPPSPLFGDEPYRLVREAADSALEALTRGEYYHQQYQEMSRRIVGFGNYMPDGDTILPDGSVNVGRDVTARDVAAGAVGFLIGTVGSVLGGVKDVFAGGQNNQTKMDGLGIDDGEEEPEAYIDDDDTAFNRDEAPPSDEEDEYRPSAGTYMPPILPEPSPVEEARQPAPSADDLLIGDSVQNEVSLLEIDTIPREAAQQHAASDLILSEAEILRVLALDLEPGQIGQCRVRSLEGNGNSNDIAAPAISHSTSHNGWTASGAGCDLADVDFTSGPPSRTSPLAVPGPVNRDVDEHEVRCEPLGPGMLEI